MTNKRRKHGSAFKARVALEAVNGIKTVSEIAAKYELHPTQVAQWKRELVERSAELFAKGDDRKTEKEIEAMVVIGSLKIRSRCEKTRLLDSIMRCR